MTDPARTRALTRIAIARDGRSSLGKHPHRFSPAREADLLAYAATVADEDILEWRNTGHAVLRWIRAHQPTGYLPGAAFGTGGHLLGDHADRRFSEVIKATGWRVELFWNESAGWFTARLISPWDRDGSASYPGGFLAPFDCPIGASGATPDEALANLSDAVLEWA